MTMTAYHRRRLRCNADITQRLAKLIPRLGTPHNGEIVATVHAIRRTLESAGLDLHDLAAVLGTPTIETAPDCWLTLARWCGDHDCGRLTQREREFVTNMVAWCHWREPTARQSEWLLAIRNRLERVAEAADA